MHRVRFLDPAGSVRQGEWNDGEVAFGTERYEASEIDVLPPCEPTKIVCIGRNYAAHAEERDEEVPDRPLLFLKPPNALAGHGDTVTLPRDRYVEHEAELGVVIGEQCRHVNESDAEEVIAGYTCFDDLSNRDDQDREQNWVRGKAFDNAAPMGPVLATPDEVADDAGIRLRVNGETRQDSSLEHLIFSIPELVAEITRYMTLEPGDVIATGTPEGVGPVEDGDRVAIEIDGVGTLKHGIRRP
jgi:2-keto-4-pentenoate hydratase/2-oxohepta-3-ene-1,7-dioic acid hydratase in catechol pathway